MEFGPDACTRTPGQQAYGFAAVAESQHEQPRPAILATLRIAHHRTTAVIDLRFFSHGGEDDARRFWKPAAPKLAHKALHGLIAACKTVIGHQVLPDRLAIAATGEVLLDQLRGAFHRHLPMAGAGSLGAPCFSEKEPTKSGVTMAGFAPESGVTRMAGFAGARRPHPGRHTTTPADFR